MKRILITGANSYIGISVEHWLEQARFEGMYQVDTVDMRGENWKEKDFSGYDAVFQVAGIAHADVGRITEEQKKMYYKVNCDLAVEAAKKAKESGVKQFIYMSSIIVYGEGSSIKKKRVIGKDTKPSPSSFYGDSKWRAEQKLGILAEDSFHVAILRPPMVYGKGCKGNYAVLSRLAKRLLVFPDIDNQRSMLYIENLCEFARNLLESCKSGIYFPQNKEYVKTADLVAIIAGIHKKKIWITKYLNSGVYLLSCCPGKIGRMVTKAFCHLVYEKELSNTEVISLDKYQVCDLKNSILRVEGSSNEKSVIDRKS